MVRPEIKKRRQELAAASIQSRKNRKKLEKIVLHKKLKVDRGNLLTKLKEFQLKPEQTAKLHSTSSMQTKGLKRFLADDGCNSQSNVTDIERAEQRLDLASLLKRRRTKRKQLVHGSSSSSSSEDTDDVSTDTEVYYNSPERDASTSDKSIPRDLETDKELVSKVVKESTSKVVAQDQRRSEIPREPAIYVGVSRDPIIEESRLKLPIIGEEQNIIEKIRYNDIVIVSGETGSGKTTQIPQFLYEAGYALNGKLIGITEPRRVAAVSMSQRVARELNLSQREISYQIRFSGNVTKQTKIKFMTDGVLLRECQQDFLLSKYSVIIIDEAHERSVFSDILIGLLSRIVPMRRKRDDPLKLVIMSATLRVDDFTNNTFLFPRPPPVINIEARQFPVTVQFSKRTPDNYLHAAYRKVCSIHSRLPRGGILVFVTSRMDVKVLCKKLREKFPCPESRGQRENDRSRPKVAPDGLTHNRLRPKINAPKNLTIENLKQDLELLSDEDGYETDHEHGFLQSSSDWSGTDSVTDEEDGTVHSTKDPLYCLGLYAMLPLDKQQKVFKEPPDGTRLCVIATNVAETSITIPNIKYVVDTGMEKTKVYDLVTGLSRFMTGWTSKSSAEQRMGRAGRTGPGFCYRLYSSSVFANDFPAYAEPRILQKPVEDVVLQMKSMNIDNVVNFPFPTRPSIDALKSAEKKLIALGALDDSKFKLARFKDISKTEFSSRLTPLGKAMAYFALSARCSKMIVLSPPEILPYVVCIVSALTVREMFLEGDKWRELKRKWAGHGLSKRLGDFMVMLRAVCVADSFKCANKLCLEHGLRTKAMLEIDKLRKQLAHEINSNLNYPMVNDQIVLQRPTENQSTILRQLLLSSYCDHVARRLPDGYVIEESNGSKEKKKLKNAYECMEIDTPVYISHESVLRTEHPEYVIYKELYQGGKKMLMRDVAIIEPEWLVQYASKLCSFSGNSARTPGTAPRFDKDLNQYVCDRLTYYGPKNWSLGSIEVPLHLVDPEAAISSSGSVSCHAGIIGGAANLS